MQQHPYSPVADVLNALLQEVQQLHTAHAVQGAAFVALARHLAVQGLADLPALAQDLELLAQTQPDADWQSGLQGLATSLLFADSLRSARPT